MVRMKDFPLAIKRPNKAADEEQPATGKLDPVVPFALGKRDAPTKPYP